MLSGAMVLHLNTKYGLSALSAICVLAFGVIRLVVPAEGLASHRWQVTVILLAFVAFTAIIVQMFVLSKEDHEQRSRLDNLVSLVERMAQDRGLLSEAAAPSAPKESGQMSPSDPRVYVEIDDRTQTERMFPPTVVVLRNHGGDVAHKVEIEPLALTTDRITFEAVDTIPAGGKSEVLPDVERVGVLQKHDIRAALLKEWNAAGKLDPEFSRKLRVTYEDFRKRRFETSFDLVYSPIRDIIRQKGRNRALDEATTVLRVTNVEIKPI